MRPAKGKSVICPAVIYAFALSGRTSTTCNNPGCRYALPWAMCFCAYSAIITSKLRPSSFDLRPSTFDLSPTSFDRQKHEEAVMAHSTDEMNVRMACIMLCFCSLFSFIILFL